MKPCNFKPTSILNEEWIKDGSREYKNQSEEDEDDTQENCDIEPDELSALKEDLKTPAKEAWSSYTDF